MIKHFNANKARLRRHRRVRKRVQGTAERPRLSVFRSAEHIYAQIIDDVNGQTLVAASSLEKDARGSNGAKAEKTSASQTRKGAKAADSAKAEPPAGKTEKAGKGGKAEPAAPAAEAETAEGAEAPAGLKGIAENHKVAMAQSIGRLIAERAKERGITKVVFDRGGYIYHGRVAALAAGAREGGLDF